MFDVSVSNSLERIFNLSADINEFYSSMRYDDINFLLVNSFLCVMAFVHIKDCKESCADELSSNSSISNIGRYVDSCLV